MWLAFYQNHKVLTWLIAAVVILVLFKFGWTSWNCRKIGTVQSEQEDIFERASFLKNKIVVSPQKLLNEMPSGIGTQFQGEWALYSCSMLNKALSNICRLYPETKDENLGVMDSLIEQVKSPELRYYDMIRWGEDPLQSLDGDKSHVSYLSHLAWMIVEYRNVGGQKHKALLDSLCETMNRRLVNSAAVNLPTYPGEPIYVPDMMVAIAALSGYGDKYQATVSKWLSKAKSEWMDEKTGLLVSFLNEDGTKLTGAPVKGSYSALNCYYLTLIDPIFAKSQYDSLKVNFRQGGLMTGLKEYNDKSCWFGLDVDAGPILFNLSPSGTAFTIGSATFFEDTAYRSKLLRTAEIAGHTVSSSGQRHYLLANLALVGEAITLAMRTNYNFQE